MTFYYQINNNENYNKIYQDGSGTSIIPEGSGFGAIPYTFGNFNKFAPKPFGLPLAAQAYSPYLDSGFREYRNASNIFTQHQNVVLGPANAVYEVIIDGVTHYTPKKCPSCDYINGTYYYYFSSTNQDTVDNSVPGPNNNVTTLTYEGQFCSYNEWFGMCELGTTANPTLKFTNVGTSGLMIEYTIYSNSSSPKYVFRKVIDYFEGQNVTTGFTNINLTNRKIKALDTSYVLPFYSGFNSTFTNDGSSTNDFDCDMANATITIQPRKDSFFDSKNISLFFRTESSGYPYSIAIGGGAFSSTTGSVCASRTPSSINNYDAITAFMPNAFRLRILGVTTASGVAPRENCISCSGFFENGFILNPFNVNDIVDGNLFLNPSGDYPDLGQVAGYSWTGLSNRFYHTGIDYNYYNICSLGCPTINTPSSGNGPCVNVIDFAPRVHRRSVGSGVFEYRLDAVINMYSAYATSAFSTHFNRASIQLVKENICLRNTQTGNNTCADSNGIPLIDCYDSNVWSDDWEARSATPSGVSIPAINDLLDIANYCNFDNITVELTPYDGNTFFCQKRGEVLCNETMGATDATVLLNADLVDGSGNVLSNLSNGTYILSNNNTGNRWQDTVSIGTLEVDLTTVSITTANFAVGLTTTNPVFQGSTGFTASASAANLGPGVSNFNIGCGSILSFSATSFFGIGNSGVRYTGTVNFSGFYSVLE